MRAELLAKTLTDEAFAEHRAIYEALWTRDVQTAQALMRKHLERYILEGFIPKNP
ncbi:FCD domain-containing protein [Candidatus Poribacteria bacterium]|nr:FCD domain-containing protein [Candidatus Poribacteria bacterium]